VSHPEIIASCVTHFALFALRSRSEPFYVLVMYELKRYKKSKYVRRGRALTLRAG